ncbi:MAG: hypothetical protein JNJ54_29500 [Myxococcaceae bacterium]|nr:hypothetical protein [Myxococcaceae bacterium]
MRRVNALVLWMASVAVASGCSNAPRPDAGVEDYEVELRQLIARFGDASHANDQNLELRRIRAALRGGRLAIDRDVLPGCLAATDDTVLPWSTWSWAVSDSARVAATPPPGSACAGLWVPRTPNGQACDTPLACVEGVCEGEGVAFQGQCGVCVPRKRMGESCGSGECGAGLTCLLVSTGVSRCAVPAVPTLGGVGGPCPCQEGLGCDGVTCKPRLGEGGECSSDLLCAPPWRCLSTNRCGLQAEGESCVRQGYCRDGAMCREPDPLEPGQWLFPTGPEVSGASGRCVTGSIGVRCRDDRDCASGLICGIKRWRGLCAPRVAAFAACEYEKQCPPGFSCARGACLPRVGPGAPCDDRSTCMPGTQCVAGRCSRQPRVGEPCAGTCNGSVCVEGRCEARRDAPCLVGEPGLDACGPASTCVQGSAVSGVGTCVLDSVSSPALCVLGDGQARDDFSGSADASVTVEPCLPTGPAHVVVPLTSSEAQCLFAGDRLCLGCHTASGCPELRPRFVPAPPLSHPSFDLTRRCGVDAGR